MNHRLEQIKKLLDGHSHRKELHYFIANLYQDLKQSELATFHYKEAIQLDNFYINAYIELGKLYLQENNIEEAQSVFDKICILLPNSTESFKRAAMLYIEFGYEDLAYEMLLSALTINTADSAIYIQIANILIDKQQYNKAILKLKKAISFNPKLISLYVHLSKALIHKEELKEALSVVENGLKLNKNSVDLNFLKAKICMSLNKESEYKQQIELLSVIAPDKILELK